MFSKVKVLLALLAVMFLSNCITLLRLTSDGNGDPISGHQVGLRNPERIVDIGDIRVRLSRVVSVRNFPIPTTYAFLFSWTPEAYDRRNAEAGRREPTQQDWNNKAARLVKAGIRPSSIAKFIRYQQKSAARSEFKPYVAPDGSIKRCNDTSGGKFGCTIGLKLSKPEQMRLARAVLAAHKPKCQLAQIDPAEVLALRPGTLKSSELVIVASVACA